VAEWCDIRLFIACLSGSPSGCQNGNGWVTIRDAGGTLVYDGCPAWEVGLGAIAAGYTITVTYSESDGPCPGLPHTEGYGGQLDISLLLNGRIDHIALINLNDETQGSFTISITQAMLDWFYTP
jgi:hypothetical protein